MNNTNTGGPAFPISGMGKENMGMTLRDYFAAKALPPMLHANAGKWAGNYDAYAQMAYEFADAMIKAREA